jgi:hypothetical protein
LPVRRRTRSAEGRPYADEWLSCSALSAVPAAAEEEGDPMERAAAAADAAAPEEHTTERAMDGEVARGRVESDEDVEAVFDMWSSPTRTWRRCPRREVELPASMRFDRRTGAGASRGAAAHNSRVYAAKAEGAMNGMFALAPCKRGDVLVEYSERLLTLAEAAASGSEYLLEADTVAQRKQCGRDAYT